MILEKLAIILSLLAGLVLTVAGFFYKMLLFELMVKLFITMLVFYVIGAIVKNYLIKNVFFEKTDIMAPEELEESGAPNKDSKDGAS